MGVGECTSVMTLGSPRKRADIVLTCKESLAFCLDAGPE